MEEFIRQAKAIADPTRARMLKLLEAGELCVCQLMEVMSLKQSTASKHLSILKTAGLVETRKEGPWSYYRLPHKGRGSASDLLEFMKTRLNHEAHIKKDRRLLEQKGSGTCK